MERDHKYKDVFDWAADILGRAGEALTGEEIWKKSGEFNSHIKTPNGWEVWSKSKNNLLKKTGHTPWSSIGAVLGEEIKNNSEYSKFVRAQERPSKYYLKSKATDIKDNIEEPLIVRNDEDNHSRKAIKWNEGDLHPLLTYFVHKKLRGVEKDQGVKTATINHSKSTGAQKNLSEWLYPDIVGFHLPLNWEHKLIELGKLSGNNFMKLYSFELKKSLSKGNYREAFFQAVSNSSWANEGYLVAANIQEDPIFLSELRRLTSSFGIGIIHLKLNDFDSSSVLYPATFKPNVDWETMNKLYTQNTDFKKFINAVKSILGDKSNYEFSESVFEDTNFDPQKYIKKHKMNV